MEMGAKTKDRSIMSPKMKPRRSESEAVSSAGGVSVGVSASLFSMGSDMSAAKK